jgi:hypothetical protein
MGAFNRRLEPKEINGMPIEGVGALVLSLVFGTLTLIVPTIAKLIFGLLLICSLVAAVVAFSFRAQLPFLFIMFQGRIIEPNRVTSEMRTRL